MEFDKSKVYTAINADELKVGSKVFAAKNLHALRDTFIENCHICTLVGIKSEDYQDRFDVKFDSDGCMITTTLVYLVSEPAKLYWTDLKVGDIITNGRHINMVTEIDKECEYNMHIYAGTRWLKDDELAEWEKVEGRTFLKGGIND